MKSSSARDLLGVLCAVLGAFAIMLERAPLAAQYKKLQAQNDVYTLPPPEQTYVASLGYRSALADLIFGHVLVSYGLHFQERRRFEYVGDYLETITRLDPKFRDPYRFADTLLTLQPEAPPQESYRRARKLQEQGLREFPYDQELWNTSGQFLAYLAPSYLDDPDEKTEFRRAGAQKLLRACELIGKNDALPYHCITAATLLNEEQGKHEANRRFLQQLISATDDPKIHEMAYNYLRRINAAIDVDRSVARAARFNTAWRDDLSFVPRDTILALGPGFEPAACAGLSAAQSQGCTTSWRGWSAATERASEP